MAATTANSQESAPIITFGVEIECLTPWLFDDQEDPHGHIPNLPPPFRVKREDLFGDTSICASDKVYRAVQDTIDSLGLGSTLVKQDAEPTDPLGGYAYWEVEEDASVRPGDKLGYESTDVDGQANIHWVPLEIQSPVEIASEERRGGANAFEILRYVIDVVTSTYRIRINQTCSVHVHVGQARERLPLNMIQRLGALCFAADPFLFTLHHPLRLVNHYCRPISEYSRLAIQAEVIPRHDETFPSSGNRAYSTECRDYQGAGLRHGEEPMSWRGLHRDRATVEAFKRTRRPGHYEPYIFGLEWDNEPNVVVERPALSDNDSIHRIIEQRVRSASTAITAAAATTTYQPPRVRTLQRIATPRPRFTDEEVQEQRERLREETGSRIHSRDRKRGQVSVFEATRRIFGTISSCEVEALLSLENYQKPSINFSSYNCAELLTGDELGTKRTIEFRLGSPSLDSEWVATWARICAGLVRFAIQAPVIRYIEVLSRCAQRTGYDIIDLLEDLGLFPEAKVAERRLAQNRVEWNLQFE